MRANLALASILVIGLVPTSSLATRLSGRWITINPLGIETTSPPSGFSLLDATRFWGEFASYEFETDIEHAYNVKLGGFVEMFRIHQDWSLAFVASTELVANQREDLSFRPRASFWEEGLILTKRFAGHRFWQLGYMHRCKHDVDNLGTSHCDGEGCERTLIYSSLQGKLLLPFAPTSAGIPTSMFSAHVDLYTMVQDEREPGGFMEHRPDVERAWGAFGADLHLRRTLHRDWLGAYLTAYGTLHLFGSEQGFFSRFDTVDETTWHAGVSAGFALQGKAHLRVGVAYEYLEDTGINPAPESAHLVSLGFSVLDSHSMW